MREIFVLAGKELRTSFVTPLAYVVMAGFLLLCGFFFFSKLHDFNSLLSQYAMSPELCKSLNELVVEEFFKAVASILIFVVPILTMRAFSEEKQNGTFELLVTSPLTTGQIVLGKFLGIWGVVFAMVLLSFAFPLVLILFSDPEVMPILVGFLGIVLSSIGFVAVSLAVSASTKNQTISGVVSLVVLLLLCVIDGSEANLSGELGTVLTYLNPMTHLDFFIRGVLTGADLFYFVSLAGLGLFVANRILEAQDWR